MLDRLANHRGQYLVILFSRNGQEYGTETRGGTMSPSARENDGAISILGTSAKDRLCISFDGGVIITCQRRMLRGYGDPPVVVSPWLDRDGIIHPSLMRYRDCASRWFPICHSASLCSLYRKRLKPSFSEMGRVTNWRQVVVGGAAQAIT